MTGDPTADHIKKRRSNSVKLVASEYSKLLPSLSGDDKQKLSEHADLVASVQKQIDFRASALCPSRPAANPYRDGLTHAQKANAFGQIITPALACDLTRVIVFQNGGDASKDINVHTDLHLDVAHSATPKNPEKMKQMTDYYTLLAKEFADIVMQFDAVKVDGNKSLLDYTTCVWMCELANGGHDLHDVTAVVVGGAETGAFTHGRYVKFAETIDNPKGGAKLGPSHQKLLVSLMSAMGVSQTTIGMKNSDLSSEQKSKYDLEGPLPMLKT